MDRSSMDARTIQNAISHFPMKTMNENQTSAAVEQVLKGSMACLTSRDIRVGIAEKYKRMEDALRYCMKYADQILSHDENNSSALSIENTCEAALSFDPLSHE